MATLYANIQMIQIQTKRFSVLGLRTSQSTNVTEEGISQWNMDDHGGICVLGIDCDYVSSRVKRAFQKRPKWQVVEGSEQNLEKYSQEKDITVLQWLEASKVKWESILAGHGIASAYCVRKGLSRKAQFWLTCKRYFTKNPSSVLKKAIPNTIVLETWEAFDENIKINFGDGDIADFGADVLSVDQRLMLCLSDAEELMIKTNQERKQMNINNKEEEEEVLWIVKPSYANKGAEIIIISSFIELQLHLLDNNSLREWVLQRYIERPLLFQKKKFHLRAYVLAVGSISVYFYNQVLLLSAQNNYKSKEYSNREMHLTNTALQAISDDFIEDHCVHLLSDLIQELISNPFFKQIQTKKQGDIIIQKIFKQMCSITSELFNAYKNEFSNFQPLSNCFELFGFDFMLDNELNVWLLEVNPEPDVKQTGDKLEDIITNLIQDTITIAIDRDLTSSNKSNTSFQGEKKDKKDLFELAKLRTSGTSFTAVYADEWSANKTSNMKVY